MKNHIIINDNVLTFTRFNERNYVMRTDLSRAMGLARHNTFASRIVDSPVANDPDFTYLFSADEGYGKNGMWGLTLKGVLYFLCRSNILKKDVFEHILMELSA